MNTAPAVNRSVTGIISPAAPLSGGIVVPTPAPASTGVSSGVLPSGRAIAPGVSSTISTILSQISAAIPSIQTVGQTDADTQRFLMGRMVVPFNTLNDAMASIFSADANANTAPLVQSAVTGLISIMSGQTASLSSSPSLNTPSTSAINYANVALQATFLNGSTNDTNLVALVCYAAEENLPAVEEELATLQAMKQLVLSIIEACSELSTAFIPQLPNAVALAKLQEARVTTAKILAELNNYGTFNRAGLQGAAASVSGAATALQTGSITEADIVAIQAQFGLTGAQTTALAAMSFTPTSSLLADMAQLQILSEQANSFDTNISALHNNLLAAKGNLQSLGMADILNLIVTVFQGQIDVLTNNLSGLTAITASQVQNALAGSNNTGNYNSIITQLNLSTQVSALSYLMQQANSLYTNFQKISNANTPAMRILVNFLNNYTADTEDITSYAALIGQDVTTFVKAINNRIAGNKTTNEVVAAAGYKLIGHIKNQVAFLWTVQDALNTNEQELVNYMEGIAAGLPGTPRAVSMQHKLTALSAPTNTAAPSASASRSNSALPSALNTITQLNSAFPQLQQTIQQLDLANLLGGQQAELQGLDALMNGLQQIISYCPNAGTVELVQQVQGQFSNALGNRLSAATQMCSFDEVPAQALSVAVTQRLTSINGAISALQTLVNSNLLQVATQAPANLS